MPFVFRSVFIGLNRLLLAAGMALLLRVPQALAQNEEKPPPFYDVPSLPDSKPWLQWTIGIILILACLMVAIRNPHRSHLD